MPRLRSLACSLAAVLSTAASMCILTPARAETGSLTCSRTPSDQADLIRAGYPTMAATVMHVGIDTSALTAADSATYPGDTSPETPTVYPATITDDMVTWSTPPDMDGDVATRYFNRNTSVLNTVDPGGTSTLWNCN
jgi:hypothetical protein